MTFSAIIKLSCLFRVAVVRKKIDVEQNQGKLYHYPFSWLNALTSCQFLTCARIVSLKAFCRIFCLRFSLVHVFTASVAFSYQEIKFFSKTYHSQIRRCTSNAKICKRLEKAQKFSYLAAGKYEKRKYRARIFAGLLLFSKLEF